MVFKNASIYDVLESTKKKSLICFGAGRQLTSACKVFSDFSFFDKIDFIADNNKDKHSFSFNGVEKSVYSIERCIKYAEKEPAIFITMVNCFDVIEQLESIPELKNIDCFIYSLMIDAVKEYYLPKNRALTEPLKIPKLIHYCWFGGTPLREDFAAYIEGWEKNCPDYEIVRWDESNYDYNKNEYMYDAYKHKKWGFVPDYARLDIICEYGGVYLDTDVELLKNIDDLLCDEAFCGFQNLDGVANGLGFGAVAGYHLIAEQMKIYDEISFLNKDGSLNLTPAPTFETDFFVSKGLKLNNTLQKLEGMMIYPSDVLNPLNYLNGKFNITENTYAIHHASATWRDEVWHEEHRKRIQKLQELNYSV